MGVLLKAHAHQRRLERGGYHPASMMDHQNKLDIPSTSSTTKRIHGMRQVKACALTLSANEALLKPLHETSNEKKSVAYDYSIIIKSPSSSRMPRSITCSAIRYCCLEFARLFVATEAHLLAPPRPSLLRSPERHLLHVGLAMGHQRQ